MPAVIKVQRQGAQLVGGAHEVKRVWQHLAVHVLGLDVHRPLGNE
jgi:hypothetical protein